MSATYVWGFSPNPLTAASDFSSFHSHHGAFPIAANNDCEGKVSEHCFQAGIQCSDLFGLIIFDILPFSALNEGDEGNITFVLKRKQPERLLM